jgi:SSS family transporter
MDWPSLLAQTDAVTAAASAAVAEPMFNWRSWVVVAAYMIFTTWLGHALSGKQATIRDFFLGGRKLPWYAVSGSIIATELSAMTLVGVPAFLWAETGNIAYGVLAIGNIVSRIVVGLYIIPAFYEREIYSPYEYIGGRLGNRAEKITSALFMLGGMMGQGTRVLLTAVVLEVVTGLDIYSCIAIVGIVAVIWTWMGGITTVIWTDVILFLIFTLSIVITILTIQFQYVSPEGTNAGFGYIIDLAHGAGKTEFFNFHLTLDHTANYTILTSLIGASIGGIAAYGTDQLMAQRSFCCKNEKEAAKAMIWSSVSQILMVLCLLMGIGLWAYYKKNGAEGIPTTEEVDMIKTNANRILPVFIKFRVDPYLGGLMVAGIFAAAISSLDSILAALSQQTLAWIGRGTASTQHDEEQGKKDIALSRVFIIIWAVVLCGMAAIFQYMASNATLLIELALSVVGVVQGGILGMFLIALVPMLRRKAPGLEWAAVLSILTIVAVVRKEDWAFYIIAAVLVVHVVTLCIKFGGRGVMSALMLIPFYALIIVIQRGIPGMEIEPITVGWPWYVPIGCIIMLATAFIVTEPADKEQMAAA